MSTAWITDGTYECLIVVADDTIKVTPSSIVCTGAEFPQDICPSSSVSASLPDGTTTTCSAGKNKIAIYVSTGSISTGLISSCGASFNPFQPPTSANDDCHGVKLSNSLIVAGDISINFTVDVQNKLNEDVCRIEPIIEFN